MYSNMPLNFSGLKGFVFLEFAEMQGVNRTKAQFNIIFSSRVDPELLPGFFTSPRLVFSQTKNEYFNTEKV